MKKLLISAGILVAAFSAVAQNGPVKMWEGVENLPTYRVNAPEKAPLFERDFAKLLCLEMYIQHSLSLHMRYHMKLRS